MRYSSHRELMCSNTPGVLHIVRYSSFIVKIVVCYQSELNKQLFSNKSQVDLSRTSVRAMITTINPLNRICYIC